MSGDDKLDAKAAYFRLLDELSGSGDFGYDNDSLGEEEEDLRRKCRKFYVVSHGSLQTAKSQPESQSQTTSQPQPAPQPEPEPRCHATLQETGTDLAPLNPARRILSAPVIKNTPLSQQGRRLRQRLAETSSFIEETPLAATKSSSNHRPLGRSETTPLPSKRTRLSSTGNGNQDSPSAPLAMKKRKRTEILKQAPEEDRIFQDLRFYYIPNDDIAMARKIKISKAREYGATWTRSVEDATHVVVDKVLTWSDVEGIVKGGKEGVVVVNEDYPLDCVLYKLVLNPDQHKYKVQGQPERQKTPEKQVVEDEKAEEEEQEEPQAVEEMPSKTPRKRKIRPGLSRVIPPDSLSEASLQSPPPIYDDEEFTEEPMEPEGERKRRRTVSPEPRNIEASQHASRQELPEHATSHDTVGDELTRYIAEMQEYKHLPLDDDHDDDLHSLADTEAVASDAESESESDDERKRKAAPTRGRAKKHIAFEDHFACNHGGQKDKNSDNPNARTIEILEQMCKYYSSIDDKWRTLGYRKAITTLRRQTRKIRTFEEAKALPTIGDRLAAKIEEIVNTDRLTRLEYAQAEPLDEVLGVFLKIYGVGTGQATKWIAQGYRTLDDLLEKAELTDNQRLGIEHYDDLNTRIPRKEVAALGDVVKKAAKKIDPTVELIIGGSYRRGSDSSNDIDFIVTKPNTTSTTELAPFLHKLVSTLEASHFLVATLASSRSRHDGSKWHGCCILPPTPGLNAPDPAGPDSATAPKEYRPTWRRIDFLLVPETQFGASLIYFTGNDIFNRSIRLLASKKGFRLNQHGLFKNVPRVPGRQKLTDGVLVEGRSERRIFEILGVQWRRPEDRWC